MLTYEAKTVVLLSSPVLCGSLTPDRAHATHAWYGKCSDCRRSFRSSIPLAGLRRHQTPIIRALPSIDEAGANMPSEPPPELPCSRHFWPMLSAKAPVRNRISWECSGGNRGPCTLGRPPRAAQHLPLPSGQCPNRTGRPRRMASILAAARVLEVSAACHLPDPQAPSVAESTG